MKLLRLRAGGYTIIEVMIVLTISAALFGTSIVAYNSQNRRTQFTESVETMAQTLQDVLNDIDTGFYATDESFSCVAGETGPPVPNDPNNPAKAQGTSSDCTFIGKAIQFAPQGEKSAYDIFTIVGRRVKEAPNSSVPVSKLSDAKPVGLTSIIDRKVLSGGVVVDGLKRIGDNTSLSTLAVVADSGTANVVSNSGFNTKSALAGLLGGLNEDRNIFLNNHIPQLGETDSIGTVNQGVNICLSEDGGGRSAYISIGGANSSKLTIETHIDKTCP